MKLLLLFAAVPLVVVGQDYDVLIHGGRLIDGTGNTSFLADVAIQDGKIARIGNLGEVNAKRVIEAKGLVVSPGFIDIHNHSDYTVIIDGKAQSMIRQGVTSMIFGEGGSAAPLGGKQEKSDDVVGWTDFDGYFSRLLKQGISTNIGSYVGSSQIWTYVRGERAGPPTAEEVAEMQALVRQAMQQGALVSCI
jgi:N-acyl-D-aspartate/D-glutamate deacylase